MSSQYELSVLDYSNEKSRVRVAVETLTAGNFTAANVLMDNLQTGIAGIILGTLNRERRVSADTLLGSTPPTVKDAQRETKWLVRQEDTVTHKISRNELPTADVELLSSNSDFITAFPTGPLATFKAAWEAAVLSPEGNPVTVISLELVGKRL
jgi:hypothetical protein